MSTTSAITNSVASSAQTTGDAITSATNQTLTEQDFLNLLVTQMTSQDPLNPMTDQDMVGQMVSFSTLQTNTSMQSLLTSMQSGQNTSQANSLIGMQVNVQTDSNGDTTQGVVSGVDLSSGTPQIIVNGQEYGLSQVLSVSPPSSQTTN
jgi:flagellar basal-body rod modification protein FlgD